MGIHRLNHAVLYISDLERSLAFYADVLGFEIVNQIPGGAFLRAAASTNDHDLALLAIDSQAQPSTAGRSTVGMYHLAWEVDTLGELVEFAERLRAARSLVGASDHGTTKSLYAKDPDGLELELVWLIPLDLLRPDDVPGTRPLDLGSELERFGPDAQSGLGVSRPAPT